MKVCFVISSMQGGGAARVISILANWLIKHVEVSILTFDVAESFYALDSSVELRSVDLIKHSTGKLKSLVNNVVRVKKLKKAIREIEPDVVVSFITEVNVLALMACANSNIKTLVSERSDPLRSDLPRSWQMLRKLYYPKANAVICQTKRGMEALKGEIPKGKHEVIYNPILLPSDMSLEKEAVILFVGRFEQYKGFDLIEKILDEVQLDNWTVEIVGGGSGFEESKEQLARHKWAEKIKVRGQVENVFEYYSKASIFVLPSRIEGFPNALVEAMAFGCACVSFDCPTGPAELIEDGVNGHLIPRENTTSMSNVIQDLMDSPAKRSSFSEEAQKSISRFSVDQIGPQWLNLMTVR